MTKHFQEAPFQHYHFKGIRLRLISYYSRARPSCTRPRSPSHDGNVDLDLVRQGRKDPRDWRECATCINQNIRVAPEYAAPKSKNIEPKHRATAGPLHTRRAHKLHSGDRQDGIRRVSVAREVEKLWRNRRFLVYYFILTCLQSHASSHLPQDCGGLPRLHSIDLIHRGVFNRQSFREEWSFRSIIKR